MGQLRAWRASTVPVAMLLAMVHAFGWSLMQLQAAGGPLVAVPGAAAAAVPVLGTPGLDRAGPQSGLAAAGDPLPAARNVQPRPGHAAVGDERRAEVLAAARDRQFRPVAAADGTVRGANPQQLLCFTYSAAGLVVTPGGAPRSLADRPGVVGEWSLRLRGERLALDGRVVDLGAAPGGPMLDGVRLACRLARGCGEWYVNAADGIEHGFTIEDSAFLPGAPPDRLEVSIRVETGLVGALEGAGERLVFRDAGGGLRLVYQGLAVLDAGGAELPSVMTYEPAAGGGVIRLGAAIAGARFPVTIDPVLGVQNEAVLAGDGLPGDEFGFASDGERDVLAVGAPGHGGGKVYLFHENHGGAGAWDEVTAAEVPAAENPAATDRFGESVAVFRARSTGKFYLAVGAPGHAACGGVFVFERDTGGAGQWGFVQRIAANELAGGDLFGCSVDGQGDTLVVGARGQGAGAAYIYQLGAGAFGFSQKLTTPGVHQAGDEFGAAVAIGGDHLVIGAPGENGDQGGAYLFERGSPFAPKFRLFTDKAESGSRFGAAVAIAATGLLLAIGMPFDDLTFGPTVVDAGSVFIYAFHPVLLAWAFITGLFGPEAGARFGSALVLNYLFELAVGAPGATTQPGVVAGAVFVYLFNALLFGYTEAPGKIVPSTPVGPGIALGTSVVLLGTLLFVLAAAHNAGTGAMFRFTLVATALTFALWQQLFWTAAQISNNPELTGPDADPDGDGLVNWLEFAMFLLPVRADPKGFHWYVHGGDELRVVFRESLVAAGVLLLVQYSLTATAWFGLGAGPLAGLLVPAIRHAGISANVLVLALPFALAPVLFLRLRAEEA